MASPPFGSFYSPYAVYGGIFSPPNTSQILDEGAQPTEPQTNANKKPGSVRQFARGFTSSSSTSKSSTTAKSSATSKSMTSTSSSTKKSNTMGKVHTKAATSAKPATGTATPRKGTADSQAATKRPAVGDKLTGAIVSKSPNTKAKASPATKSSNASSNSSMTTMTTTTTTVTTTTSTNNNNSFSSSSSTTSKKRKAPATSAAPTKKPRNSVKKA